MVLNVACDFLFTRIPTNLFYHLFRTFSVDFVLMIPVCTWCWYLLTTLADFFLPLLVVIKIKIKTILYNLTT